MGSRCMSAVDTINEIALDIERKHRKNDVFIKAENTLTRIRKERSLAQSPSQDGICRQSSLPASISRRRENFAKGERRFSQSSSGSSTGKRWKTAWPKSNQSVRSSSARYSTQRQSPRSSAQETNLEEQSKTADVVGKSYTNRCVKEILNKLEHGSYASEWYVFSNTRLPSPKWIDFYSGGSGGVLDAFLCDSNDKGDRACYMMDVRIGEKVGRLLKYPGNVRVGRNGRLKEKGGNEMNDEKSICSEEEEHEAKCKESKTRPYPLSWNEQFTWENVKVLTTSSEDQCDKEDTEPNFKEHKLKKCAAKTKGNEEKDSGISRTGHGYTIKPVDMRVVQSLPNLTTRQKVIRGFRIENSSKTISRATNSSRQTKIVNTPVRRRGNSLTRQELSTESKIEGPSTIGKGSPDKQTLGRWSKPLAGEMKSENQTKESRHGNRATWMTESVVEKDKLNGGIFSNEGNSSVYNDTKAISYTNEKFIRFKDIENEGKSKEQSKILRRISKSNEKQKPEIRIPSLTMNLLGKDDEKDELINDVFSSEEHLSEEKDANTSSVLLFYKHSEEDTQTCNVHNDKNPKETDSEARSDSLLQSEEESAARNSVQEGSSTEQLAMLRQSIRESIGKENSQLEKDVQLLQLKHQGHD